MLSNKLFNCCGQAAARPNHILLSCWALLKRHSRGISFGSRVQHSDVKHKGPTLPISGLFSQASESASVLHSSEPFVCELGGSLPELTFQWEEWGAHNEKVVLILPSLSVGSHARSSVEDPTSGWWEGMIGPGKGLDTEKFRVICASNIGSPYGSTSPLFQNPETGEPYGPDFPQITPRDLAGAQKRFLDLLGVKKLHAVVGASLGGMQTLEFAAEYPSVADRVVSISSTGKTTPHSVALRRVQRRAILTDPLYADGRYYRNREKPVSGMRVARELGMITYRSATEFNQRFSWSATSPFDARALSFDVERYLDNKSVQFANHFDPNCFLLLSKCTDLMDLGRGFRTYSEGALRIGSQENTEILIIGGQLDILTTSDEGLHLYNLLHAHGRDVHFQECPSIYGHDAFLIDYQWFVPKIRAFLDTDLS